MMFLKRLFPDIHRKNIYDIDYRELYKRGFRGILFDIDNTLTTHGTVADEGNIEFFENLRNMGIRLVANDFLEVKDGYIRHDAGRVATVILSLAMAMD